MSSGKQVVGLGELLWDMFPSGKQLGGAPANFAYIATLLGDHGVPASRVGNDPLGREAIARLRRVGLATEFVQTDKIHPTGTVRVELDSAGQAKFEILKSVAWDFLDWRESWKELAAKADAVCFGSLAQRSACSRETILNFLRATRPEALRIFDVNLRQDFYSREIIESSMKLAGIVKMNHHELPIILQLFGLEQHDDVRSATSLLERFNLKMVCLTRGNAGSMLITPAASSEHPGFKIKIADTVGAGDAFTAALAHKYLHGAGLAEINEHANRVGAWVASQRGGMPVPGAQGLTKALATVQSQ